MSDDLISRQAAIDIKVSNGINEDGVLYVPYGEVKMFLKSLPSAQPEIIRCKDCRFHENEQPGMVYCPAVVGGWVENDWFCKGGERRTDG